MNIPIIGVVSIIGTEDALEFLIAGATAVERGTYNLIDSKMIIKTTGDIRKYLIEKGISSLGDIIETFER